MLSVYKNIVNNLNVQVQGQVLANFDYVLEVRMFSHTLVSTTWTTLPILQNLKNITHLYIKVKLESEKVGNG